MRNKILYIILACLFIGTGFTFGNGKSMWSMQQKYYEYRQELLEHPPVFLRMEINEEDSWIADFRRYYGYYFPTSDEVCMLEHLSAMIKLTNSHDLKGIGFYSGTKLLGLSTPESKLHVVLSDSSVVEIPLVENACKQVELDDSTVVSFVVKARYDYSIFPRYMRRTRSDVMVGIVWGSDGKVWEVNATIVCNCQNDE